SFLAGCGAEEREERAMQSNNRWFGVVVAIACAAAVPSTAIGASNPKAIAVRIKCQLQGVNGTPDGTTASCTSLNGWFEGRLDWVNCRTAGVCKPTDGVVLFQENGPFVGVRSGTDEVIVFADGNEDEKAFAAFYEDPKTSVFTAPDLHLRLYVGD